MAPFDNGSLLVAMSYYLWRSQGLRFDQPLDLLECIAAANFCKFAISGTVNKDYVGKREKVNVSLRYVVADLEVLNPSVCFLPKALLDHASIRQSMQSVGSDTKLIGLPQFNATVVNTHLKKHSDAAARLAEQLTDHPIAEWIDLMPGYAKGFPYRYLVEMGSILDMIAALIPPPTAGTAGVAGTN